MVCAVIECATKTTGYGAWDGRSELGPNDIEIREPAVQDLVIESSHEIDDAFENVVAAKVRYRYVFERARR
jgi:hypothetical protein